MRPTIQHYFYTPPIAPKNKECSKRNIFTTNVLRLKDPISTLPTMALLYSLNQKQSSTKVAIVSGELLPTSPAISVKTSST